MLSTAITSPEVLIRLARLHPLAPVLPTVKRYLPGDLVEPHLPDLHHWVDAQRMHHRDLQLGRADITNVHPASRDVQGQPQPAQRPPRSGIRTPAATGRAAEGPGRRLPGAPGRAQGRQGPGQQDDQGTAFGVGPERGERPVAQEEGLSQERGRFKTRATLP